MKNIIIIGASVLILGLGLLVTLNNNEQSSDISSYKQPNVVQTTVTNEEDERIATADETEAQLLYLIEEEKLAHDVYTVFYEKYGAKVFGNILESESTHQGRVLVLLNARNIPDPRSNEVGVFNNTELQNLYNDLINRGMQNETEAFKVGVIIEERDIKDITNQLATTTDQDVIDALESLRSGSENHLRAFNKQL